MRKAHLFNQENKMKLINQQLYKRRKIAFKKLRIQQLQQQQQQPINININTGFEANRRIKEIYKKLELLAPEENFKKAFEKTDGRMDLIQKEVDFFKDKFMEEKKEKLKGLKAREEQLKKENEQKKAKFQELTARREQLEQQAQEREEKAKQLTPRDLRLNAALVRQEEKRKEKRERINSLFM